MNSTEISSNTFSISSLWCYKSFYSIFSLLVWSNIFFCLQLVYPVLMAQYGVVFMLAIGFHLLSVLCILCYSCLWRKNFHFVFTQDGIVLSTGIIGKSQRTIPYYTIQNIYRSKSNFDYFSGLTNIHIENASGGGFVSQGQSLTSGIHIPGLADSDAQKLYKILIGILRSNTTIQTL